MTRRHESRPSKLHPNNPTFTGAFDRGLGHRGLPELEPIEVAGPAPTSHPEPCAACTSPTYGEFHGRLLWRHERAGGADLLGVGTYRWPVHIGAEAPPSAASRWLRHVARPARTAQYCSNLFYGARCGVMVNGHIKGPLLASTSGLSFPRAEPSETTSLRVTGDGARKGVGRKKARTRFPPPSDADWAPNVPNSIAPGAHTSRRTPVGPRKVTGGSAKNPVTDLNGVARNAIQVRPRGMTKPYRSSTLPSKATPRTVRRSSPSVGPHRRFRARRVTSRLPGASPGHPRLVNRSSPREGQTPRER